MLTKIALKPALMAGRGGKGVFPGAFRLLGPHSKLDDVFHLRHQAYLASGWIAPRDDAMLSDSFDHLSSTWNLAAYTEDGCIGAFRLAMSAIGDEPGTMPCTDVFPAAIAGLKDRGYSRVCEFGRLAIRPELPSKSFRSTLLVSLVRAAGVLCYASGVDYALIAVHKRFSRFHQTMFGFERLGGSDAYNDIDEPTHLLGRAFQGFEKRYEERNRFFSISDTEVEQARIAIRALGVEQGRVGTAGGPHFSAG